MKKISKCCNKIAYKQEVGNYFCSHCISICDIKYNFKFLYLIFTVLVMWININCYAPNNINIKIQNKEHSIEDLNDYYKVNPLKIEIIESNGNSMAISFKDAKGLMQITSICLEDYNKLNKAKYTQKELFDPIINKKIANWYISKRIPQLLKEHKLRINVQNILICYNGGINICIKYNKTGKLNSETQNYLNKYFKQI